MDQILTPDVVLYSIIGWIVFENTLNIYISLRQVKVYKNTKTIPKEVEKIMNKETFDKARLYGLDKIQYEMFEAIMDMIITILVLYFGLIALIWHMAEILADQLNFNPNSEIIVSCIFILMVFCFDYVLEMPFEVYDTFVLEEKYGFNKVTAKFYVVDQIMGIIGALLSLPPIVAGIVYVVQIGGQYFFIWLWLFNGILFIVLLTIYPMLLDNYIPLEKGPLRQSIENLAASVKFPLTQLYVVEGSKLSSHSNAYFYGFWKSKRIVLYDTLLLNKGKKDETQLKEEERGKGCTDMEVLAVLAHEFGHWKLGHFIKNIIILEVCLLLMFVAFGYLYQYGVFYQAVGFEPRKQPIVVGLIVILVYIMAPLNFLSNIGATMLSRKFEYDADEFAFKLGFSEQLDQALIKLYSDNLKFPVDDWLYSWCINSHPTLIERLDRLKKLDEAKKSK